MRGLLALATLLFASAQTRGTAPEEVRIASAIYSPPPLRSPRRPTWWNSPSPSAIPKIALSADCSRTTSKSSTGGTRQTITVFDANAAAHAASPARTLALFFDDTHAAAPALQKARDAAARFVAYEMQPGDRAGVFTTSGVETVDFTGDREALAAALARIRPHGNGARPGLTCPVLGEFEAYAIAHNFDPAIKARAVMQAIACNCPQSGRRP